MVIFGKKLRKSLTYRLRPIFGMGSLTSLSYRVHDREQKRVDHHARTSIAKKWERNADDRQEAGGRTGVQRDLRPEHHRSAQTDEFFKILIREGANPQNLENKEAESDDHNKATQDSPFLDERCKDKIFRRLGKESKLSPRPLTISFAQKSS